MNNVNCDGNRRTESNEENNNEKQKIAHAFLLIDDNRHMWYE